MEKPEDTINSVKSLNVPERIAISGFEAADGSVHMLEWMRRGRDFRQFVVNDIETELYAQDPRSQLLFVTCKATPKLETKLTTDRPSNVGIVKQFSASFPISLRVRSADGVVWRLEVNHTYQATNLDVTDEMQLRLDFTIVGHQIEVDD